MTTQISIHAQCGIAARSHSYQEFPSEGWVAVHFLGDGETILHIHSLDRAAAARLAQAINEVFAPAERVTEDAA